MAKEFTDQEYRIHSVTFGDEAITLEWQVVTEDGPGYTTFNVTTIEKEMIGTSEALSYDFTELYSSALDLLWHWIEAKNKK